VLGNQIGGKAVLCEEFNILNRLLLSANVAQAQLGPKLRSQAQLGNENK
jgi:hypothetical protein